MTREEAKELLPIIQVFAEGKMIQDKIEGQTDWVDTDEINLEYNGQKIKHRIKPEPKYRPFNSKEECWEEMKKHKPFGWIKSNDNDLYSIASINCEGITTFAYYRFLESFEKFTFIDGTPFGIKKE